jgi:hypothetical protein
MYAKKMQRTHGLLGSLFDDEYLIRYNRLFAIPRMHLDKTG